MAKESLSSRDLEHLSAKRGDFRNKARLPHFYEEGSDTPLSQDMDPITHNLGGLVDEFRQDFEKLYDDVHHLRKCLYNAFGATSSEDWAAVGPVGPTGAGGPSGGPGPTGPGGPTGPK